MFGMGGSEILVILIIALLFLGPEKLPDAAKQISKGIRDLKKQSRVLQQQIENDEHIGGAIRDLKSALRGEDVPVQPKPRKPVKKKPAPLPEGTVPAEGAAEAKADGAATAPVEAKADQAETASGAEAKGEGEPEAALEEAGPKLTLPPVAGEADPDVRDDSSPEELAALIKPASGTVAKGEAEPAPGPKSTHG